MLRKERDIRESTLKKQSKRAHLFCNNYHAHEIGNKEAQKELIAAMRTFETFD